MARCRFEERFRKKLTVIGITGQTQGVKSAIRLLSVGYLAGLTDSEEKRDYSGDSFGKMLVMGGFLGSDIDKLLAAMRKAGFGRDVLKAVITPTNSEWCGGELYSEIYKDHIQMSKK